MSVHSRLRKKRDSLKQKLSKKYCEERSKCRNIQENLVKNYRKQKEFEINDARRKVDHYREREKLDMHLRKAPPGTEELLSDVNVFTEHQSNIKPEEPALPFICHESIKLSQDELNLLSRGPN